MKRLFWLGVGLAVGVVVMRKVNRAAQQFTPSGLASSLSESADSLVESLRGFVADVREGMAEREREIHAALAEGVRHEDESAELRDDDRRVGAHRYEGSGDGVR